MKITNPAFVPPNALSKHLLDYQKSRGCGFTTLDKQSGFAPGTFARVIRHGRCSAKLLEKFSALIGKPIKDLLEIQGADPAVEDLAKEQVKAPVVMTTTLPQETVRETPDLDLRERNMILQIALFLHQQARHCRSQGNALQASTLEIAADKIQKGEFL